MKYNYPVKFAVMPIIEPVGWNHGLHELEKECDVVCYIVSKCYLLRDITKYKENGKSEKKYEVVFPYAKGKFQNWYRVTPSFNLFSHECINSGFVEKVFDSYEEALELAREKNKDLKTRILKGKQEFNNKLSKYKKLEQQILTNTSDLDQSNVKELKELILNSKDGIKILSNNLYDYLRHSYSSKYIVYSISLEQYEKLLSLINDQDIQDISDVSKIIGNARPLLYHDPETYGKKIMIIDDNGNVVYYIDEWDEWEILTSSDEKKVPSTELNCIDDETRCLFTTETLEDVILSFYPHDNIDLNKIQKRSLKNVTGNKK